MDVITYALAKKYADEQMKNIPGYLESVRNQLKAIQDILTLERSDPITQTVNLADLGGSVASGVVDGVVDMTVKGRTGRNLLEHGNFPDGSDKWTVVGGTLTISNNTAIVTGSGANSYAWLMQSPLPLPGGTGKEIFCRVKIKIDNTDCNLIRVYGFDGTSSVIFDERTNPVQDQEYTLYGIAPLVSDSKFGIYTFHRYADAATANGKVMEVQEVFVLDLDAEGLAGKTADEINTMFPDWFDGTKSTGPKRMRVVGKNLIKGESEQNNHLFNQGGGIWTYLNVWENGKLKVTNGSNSVHGLGVKLKTKIGEAYTIKCQAQDADDAIARVIVGDNTGTGVRYGNYYPNTEVSFTFVADANEIIIRFIRAGLSNPDKPIYFWNIQFEEGAIATTREPYKESLVYAPEVGRSLPNGVADEVDVNEGVKAKNVSDWVILNGDENWVQKLVSTNTIMFGFGGLEKPHKVTPDVVCTRSFPITSIRNNLWNADIEGVFFMNPGQPDPLRVNINKFRLTTQDVAGFKAWLQANPISLLYELANPETIQHDIPPQSLLSFENGTLLQEHAIGEVTFYAANCQVSDSNYPIEELDFIKKVNLETGATAELDVSIAVIAPDGLSFTHPDLSVGDLVDWDRYYSSELSTLAELEYTVPLANVKSSIIRTQQLATKTADYTVTADDYIILADGSTAAVNITLPSVLVSKGLSFKVKAINITNAVKILTEGAETIDEAIDHTFSTANEVIEVLGDGANWVIV